MGRKNEPPIGRMGFGPREAYDSGIPWNVIRPRSLAEIAAEREAKDAERAKLEAEVKKLSKDHPHLKDRAMELARLRWSPADILDKLKQEASENRYRHSVLFKQKNKTLRG